MDMEGDAAIHYNLGNAYAEAGDKKRALAAFERAVAEDPEYWQAWLNLGGVKAALGDLTGGEEIFARVAQKAPRQVEPWMNLAHVRIMQRDLEGAFSYYESALAANPKLLPAYVEMIRLYGQMGDPSPGGAHPPASGRSVARRERALASVLRRDTDAGAGPANGQN